MYLAFGCVILNKAANSTGYQNVFETKWTTCFFVIYHSSLRLSYIFFVFEIISLLVFRLEITSSDILLILKISNTDNKWFRESLWVYCWYLLILSFETQGELAQKPSRNRTPVSVLQPCLPYKWPQYWATVRYSFRINRRNRLCKLASCSSCCDE